MALAHKIIAQLEATSGMPDRPLTEAIFGSRYRATQINQECRYMEQLGLINRKPRHDGLIGNFMIPKKPQLRLV